MVSSTTCFPPPREGSRSCLITNTVSAASWGHRRPNNETCCDTLSRRAEGRLWVGRPPRPISRTLDPVRARAVSPDSMAYVTRSSRHHKPKQSRFRHRPPQSIGIVVGSNRRINLSVPPAEPWVLPQSRQKQTLGQGAVGKSIENLGYNRMYPRHGLVHGQDVEAI